MWCRVIALAVVGVLLVCVPSLAHADPPDQTWIAGLWDDADYDDVVILVTSTSGVTETAALDTLAPYWIPIWTIRWADDSPAPSPVFARHLPPKPPLG